MSGDTFADRGADRPSPWVFDALLGIAVTLIVCVVIASGVGGGTVGPWPYVWAIGLGALMLVRRRYPAVVAFISVGAVIAYYAVGFTPIGVAVPVAAAIFSAAEFGRMPAAICAALTIVGVSVGYRILVGQDPLFVIGFELPGHLLLLTSAIALGDSLRVRRELHQRTRQITALNAERAADEAERRIMTERLSVARDVHDTVGHALTVISLHSELAADSIGKDTTALEHALRIISSTTAATTTDLRRTVAALRQGRTVPPSPLSLTDIEDLTTPARDVGLDVTVTVSIQSVPTPTVVSAVHRIVQESVTNAVKHADATFLNVAVIEQGGAITIDVRNDDAKRDTTAGETQPSAGVGLVGMKERAELLGGSFTATRTDNEFSVRASLPMGAK